LFKAAPRTDVQADINACELLLAFDAGSGLLIPLLILIAGTPLISFRRRFRPRPIVERAGRKLVARRLSRLFLGGLGWAGIALARFITRLTGRRGIKRSYEIVHLLLVRRFDPGFFPPLGAAFGHDLLAGSERL
jgi:hypothetical protein